MIYHGEWFCDKPTAALYFGCAGVNKRRFARGSKILTVYVFVVVRWAARGPPYDHEQKKKKYRCGDS
jgi:hypothetical protein